jgi:hypothetical protein
VNGAAAGQRVSPALWVSVGFGYAIVAAVFVLRLVGSDLPATMEVPGAVAFAAVAAVPSTLALAGLARRPVLMLPAGVTAATSLPVLSVLGVPMAVLGVVWLISYSTNKSGRDVLRPLATTLLVWVLWVAAAATLFVHLDARCVQTLVDGSVIRVDAAELGWESGWLWATSATSTGSSILSVDVVGEACSSDIVTVWEALVSLALATGAVGVGWLMAEEPSAAPASR